MRCGSPAWEFPGDDHRVRHGPADRFDDQIRVLHEEVFAVGHMVQARLTEPAAEVADAKATALAGVRLHKTGCQLGVPLGARQRLGPSVVHANADLNQAWGIQVRVMQERRPVVPRRVISWILRLDLAPGCAGVTEIEADPIVDAAKQLAGGPWSLWPGPPETMFAPKYIGSPEAMNNRSNVSVVLAEPSDVRCARNSCPM